MNKLSKKLSDLRRNRNLTQEQLSKRIGISRGYLSDIEIGAKEPSLSTLSKICRTLRVSPNLLLGYV